MSRKKKAVIEYRNYKLPPAFPVLLLHGSHWRISDIPSDRLHIHNCLEIGLCESDRGFMKLEDTICPFEKGDITAISCDIPHTTYSAPGSSSLWTYLFADIDSLLFSRLPGAGLAEEEISLKLSHNISMIMKPSDQPVIHRLVHEIKEEMIRTEPYYEISVRGLFQSLAVHLCLAEASARNRPEQQPENTLAIAPALAFIRDHYMDDFPMEALAAQCGLSPAHFRRLFHSVTGQSPLEHLQSARIRHGADLLRMTEYSILHISGQAGFRSVSGFNRHFHRLMGETPRDYRKRTSAVKDQSILSYSGWMSAEQLKPRSSIQLPNPDYTYPNIPGSHIDRAGI